MRLLARPIIAASAALALCGYYCYCGRGSIQRPRLTILVRRALINKAAARRRFWSSCLPRKDARVVLRRTRCWPNLTACSLFPGAQVIVLEEHVDYWNHDGWTDKYSSSAITDRQTEYKSRFKLNDVYTPEMVVDGDTQFNGSDPKAAVHAIEEARASRRSR